MSIAGISLFLLAGTAAADTFRLREALADVTEDEGFRVALSGLDMEGADLSDGSLLLTSSGSELTSLPLSQAGCFSSKEGCLFDWFAAPEAGDATVVDSFSAVVRPAFTVAASKEYTFSLNLQTDGGEVAVKGILPVGESRDRDGWIYIDCLDGTCYQAGYSAAVGTASKIGGEVKTLGDLVSYRVRATLSGKDRVRIEAQAGRFVGGWASTELKVSLLDPAGKKEAASALLDYKRSTLEVTADADTAAALKADVGIRQGELDIDWSLQDSLGIPYAEGLDVLEVDIEDLVLEELWLGFDAADGGALAYRLAAASGATLGSTQARTLKKYHKGLGEKGDVVSVKPGFSRLFPVPSGSGLEGTVTVALSELTEDDKAASPTPATCTLDYAVRSSCTLSNGDTLRIARETKDGEAIIRVISEGLSDADGDGELDGIGEQAELTIKGSTGAVAVRNTRGVFWTEAIVDLPSIAEACLLTTEDGSTTWGCYDDCTLAEEGEVCSEDESTFAWSVDVWDLGGSLIGTATGELVLTPDETAEVFSVEARTKDVVMGY